MLPAGPDSHVHLLSVAQEFYHKCVSGDDGIKASVLCSQAVQRPMLGSSSTNVAGVDGIIEPEELADTVIEGLADERFLVLPHAVVLEYMRRKTGGYDRWRKGMRRLRKRYV